MFEVLSRLGAFMQHNRVASSFRSVNHNTLLPGLQYFEDRLNATERVNGTSVGHKDYFKSWMTLLSQLPLLLFTLLNSFLYQRSVIFFRYKSDKSC